MSILFQWLIKVVPYPEDESLNINYFNVSRSICNRTAPTIWGVNQLTPRLISTNIYPAIPAMHPVTLNVTRMAIGVVILLIVSLHLDEPLSLLTRTETRATLAYVVAIGSVIVILLQVFIAQHWTASRASYVMVVITPVTLTLPIWLDQEPITNGLIIGAVFVLGGVYIGTLRNQEY